MTKLFLTKDELVDLTHRKTHSAQVQALNQMGITHKKRPDGSVAVFRDHVASLFGAKDEREKKSLRRNQPDFEGVR